MASNFEIKIEGYLKEFLIPYDLPYEAEADGGFKTRFDFLIPTEPPICIEADGIQHYQPNNFFFKTVESYQHYKNNDKYKDMQSNVGNIHLIRIDNEQITYEEFTELLEPFEEVLISGVNNSYAEKSKKDKERDDSRRNYGKTQKEKNKAYRQEQYKKAREKSRIYQEEQKKNKGTGEKASGGADLFRDIFST